MKIGVLASGDLGLETLTKIVNEFKVNFVLTDKKSTDIISYCKLEFIPFFVGNPRGGNGYSFIKNIKVDIIASINYLFLIEKDIILHPRFLTFNIHGSLLPKYRGRAPHIWAIINNEKETGITAHVIDEKCDSGDIISQIKIKIEEDFTGNDLLNKYKLEYFNLIKEVIDKVKNKNLRLVQQDNTLATFFSKRTPDDGQINWNWQIIRIKNWIRALSFPYPGAFTYLEEKKIIIDKVSEVSYSFCDKIENGTIIAVNPNIIVKTPNGVLSLIKYRQEISVKVGDKFI